MELLHLLLTADMGGYLTIMNDKGGLSSKTYAALCSLLY